MTKWEGFSPRLRTGADLLAKMHHDLARLERDPNDDFAAWDFFIEAEHMRDWVTPGAQRQADTELLRAISHLGNRAKHLRTDRHTAVSAVGRQGAFDPGAFDPGAFYTERLVVDLDEGQPRTESALELARSAVAFWERELT
jgi:hypothetical protein